jgi:membrane protease YdiL (CAAX protease family)
VVNPIHLLAVLAVWLGATATAKALLLRIAPSLETMRQDVLAELAAQAVWLGASLAVGALAFKGGLVAGMGLSLRHWLYDSGRAVLGYLAVLPICAALLYVSTRLFHHIYHSEPPEHIMLQALGTLPAAWKALVVISAVVLAPLAEEIFCRGLLQSMIRRYTRRPWLAILLTSLTFSLLHLQTTAIDGRDIANWQPMGALFALSVVLGYNYERSGRLYAPILIHALFNAVNVGIYLANC